MSDSARIAIRTRGLTKTFLEGERRHVVLDGVDLDVFEGESVAIRGRSGSGKSTFLNLVAGMDTADSGTVAVGGRELHGLSERERTLFRREHIGFVFQSFNLVPTLSVSDNVRLVLELNGVRGGKANARIDELLKAVGLGDRADSFPDVLSGGEQQRVAIARALCHRPSVLIADEPTGNLDDASAESVLELLDRLVRREGGTMLVATHSARIADSCNRTLTMHNGRLESAA